MSDRSPKRRSLGVTWRTAGLPMVILAFALSGVGLSTAFRFADAQFAQMIVQPKDEARQIANTSAKAFDDQTQAVLRAAADAVAAGVSLSSITKTSVPDWIDGLYVWDGILLDVTRPARDHRSKIFKLVRARMGVRPLTSPSDRRLRYRIELLYDNVSTIEGNRTIKTDVVLAYRLATSTEGKPVRVIARIRPDLLRAAVLDPRLAGSDKLEVIAENRATGPWSQRLPEALRFWVLQPTSAFVIRQQSSVITQKLTYTGLNMLTLGTLLAAIAFVIRAIRREVELSELKTNFVADVSHELKTPLALIRMFGETLQQGRVATAEKRQEYYTIIARESTRLTNLINNILDFARIDSGRKQYTLQTIDLAAVVRDTYESYRFQLEHQGFEHRLTVSDSLPAVSADPEAVAQALVNLMSNAAKYSEDDRFLEVEVSPDTRRGKNGVVIAVHDRGIGISPEDREHLFEGFYRASDARVRRQRGVGLGLALVKHIMDGHNGWLDVESRLVKGSTFRMFFPAVDAVSDGPAPDAP